MTNVPSLRSAGIFILPGHNVIGHHNQPSGEHAIVPDADAPRRGCAAWRARILSEGVMRVDA